MAVLCTAPTLCQCCDHQANWKILFPGPESSRDLNDIIEFQCEETLKYQASSLWGNKASVFQTHIRHYVYEVPLV